ncbi:P-loop containing nucleoside triphosphate hydrolase protein, partial [Mycena pura]
LDSSSGSISIFPAYPQIFHGRDFERDTIVTCLMGDSAYIAILGAGGMGKTSLAIAALHHPDVAEKFNNRYFVSCHSDSTSSDLITNIASHVGVAGGPGLLRKIVRNLKDGPPALLILDNLETSWEPMSSRVDVEELLSMLTDIQHLALVVTMRGAERPKGVKWTRPFLPPLEPLEDSAALQTFHDVAGEDHEQNLVRELLNLTGNLPLAVDLIANTVAHDGCETTLTRWRTESTRVVSDGYDKRSNLDISIMLSFSSARMTADAQALLSILSILPDGLSDAELVQSDLPIADIRLAKTTLLRTALAHVGRTSRLYALVPIREHVRGMHPPPRTLKTALRAHY